MLVLGLGPVGQLAALLLARAGVRVVGVDRAPGPHALPRAAAVDDEVLRILQNAGVRLPGLVADPDVELVSRTGRVLPVIAPRARPYGHPPLAFLHQARLEQALCDALAAQPSATLRWGAAVEEVTADAGGVAVRAGGEILRGGWLLGCDGARSLVRRARGIGFPGVTAEQPWIVVDARVDAPVGARPRAQFVGDVRRPSVNLPLGPDHHRWEFLTLPGEDPLSLIAPGAVRERISPWLDPDRAHVERAVVYLYEARAAVRWRDGRVMLLGDAAHVMPPFAGQGMSSGLRDAANVTWKLAAVIAGRSEDRLLDSYEAERRPHVASLTRLALGWGAVVQTRRPRLAAARDGAVATGTRLPGLRRAVEGYRMKPAAAFRAGAFSRSRRLPLGLRPGGRLFPQPRVGVDGRDMALDDALGPGWAVIGFGGDPEAGMGPAARFTLRRLPATRAAVLPAGAPAPPGVRALEDRDGSLTAWARRHRARQVLLRPDRVVFAATGSNDAEAPAALWRALSGAR